MIAGPDASAAALSREEPVRGFYFDPTLFAALSGLDLMRSFHEGGWLPPPIHYLTGLTFESVTEDTATFTLPASGWLLAPQGLISGAAMAILTDGPLGCAVQTALPPATPYTTAEMSLTFLSPVNAGSGLMTAVGRRIHAGRTVLMAEATLSDASGRVVALASTRCLTLPRVELPPEAIEAVLANRPRLAEPGWPTPHPFERLVEGTILPQEVWDRSSGLDVMRGCVRGETRPPIANLLGVKPVKAEEGYTTWTMPATEWMCSPVRGRLYGGIIAYLAGTAIDGAFQTIVPAATAFATLDLKVFFLRAVAPDGRDLTATGTVVHRGRTIAVGTSEVLDADGRRVALATSSAMILPGRPAAVARAVDSAPAVS